MQLPMAMEPNFVESVNTANYWKRPREESENRSFNFNIKPEEMDFHRGRKSCKQQRDPMSHRIIEKRRRDRMNNCLADLSRLIPHGYIKQGQGRIEKTEIIEMAIKHITSLQMQVKHDVFPTANKTGVPVPKDEIKQSFVQGFQMCKTEVFTFLVEVEGVSPSNPFCTRICSHLDNKTKELGEHAIALKDPVESVSIDTMKSGTDYKALQQEVEVKQPESNKMDMAAKSPPIHMEQQKQGQRNNMLSDLETDSGVSLKSLNTSSQFSSQTSSDESMEERGAENKGYYKFKHCIRRRFSREIKSDSSSVSSQEQDREVRHKHSTNRHHKLSSSASSVQSSASSTSSIESGASTRTEEDGLNLVPSLPGFVIHPSGTHYVPISINQSFLPDLLDSSNYSNQKVFHPISIPVHFCAAYKLKV